jgi:hypothetical protein
MWARVSEVLLGVWVFCSPFIFHSADHAISTNDVICGLAISAFALLSFTRTFRHAHFATIAVAAWLVVLGFLTPAPAPPASQNHILSGLLLLMFSIIPNHASHEESWERLPSIGE